MNIVAQVLHENLRRILTRDAAYGCWFKARSTTHALQLDCSSGPDAWIRNAPLIFLRIVFLRFARKSSHRWCSLLKYRQISRRHLVVIDTFGPDSSTDFSSLILPLRIRGEISIRYEIVGNGSFGRRVSRFSVALCACVSNRLRSSMYVRIFIFSCHRRSVFQFFRTIIVM